TEDRSVLGAELYPWAETLWIKTGSWDSISREPDWAAPLPRPLHRAYAFWAARKAPSLPSWELEQLTERAFGVVMADRDGGNKLGFRTTVQAMALARVARSSAFPEIDAEVARLLSVIKVDPVPSTQAALRTAIVLGESSRVPALHAWLSG